MKAQFEEVYYQRYSSRILQWVFEESRFTVSMTVPAGTVDLRVNFDQLMVLNAFDTISDLSFTQLVDQTKLPVSHLITAIQQLCSEEAGGLLQILAGSIEDQSASIHFNDTPSLSTSTVDLVPKVSLTIHTPMAAPIQDMTVIHRTKVDAAVVRIMKKRKVMSYSDLIAELSTVLDFLPEVWWWSVC